MTTATSDESAAARDELWIEGRALLPEGVRDVALHVAAGQLRAVAPRTAAPPPAGVRRCVLPREALVAPGFIDLHVHGARGRDAEEGQTDALQALAAGHAAHGTTALCPTVLSGPAAGMLAAAACIARAARQAPRGARILGAHLEGPFLAPSCVGAHPPQHVRAPDLALLEELLAAAAGTLRVMTLAPELPGALRLVERLCAAGVVVSIGHSAASYEEALRAIEAGCRSATHVFNAMPQLHHRQPGVLGAILESDAVVGEVIADGVHVAAPVLRLLRRLKGDRHLALVTDCTAALEAPAGQAVLGGRLVSARDGASRFADGALAGSLLTMERAVRNQVALAGAQLPAALASASAVPAAVLGLSGLGRIVSGAQADLVVLDGATRVSAVLVGGALVAGAL